MATTKALAIIAGAGPGTGSAVAARFAQAYTVIVLARTAASFDGIVNSITSNGGTALGIPTDVTDASSVSAAFKKIAETYPNTPVAAAVFNASAGFIKKPFLELTAEEYSSSWTVNGHGAFLFSQAALPLLAQSTHLKYPPTLIFTGATAGVKTYPNSATFGAGNHAKRALSGSLAKEFGPKGVHVSHVVVDGPINTPASKSYYNGPPEGLIAPSSIAETYWHLHTQPKTAFTWELDIRTAVEKW